MLNIMFFLLLTVLALALLVYFWTKEDIVLQEQYDNLVETSRELALVEEREQKLNQHKYGSNSKYLDLYPIMDLPDKVYEVRSSSKSVEDYAPKFYKIGDQASDLKNKLKNTAISSKNLEIYPISNNSNSKQRAQVNRAEIGEIIEKEVA